MFRLFLALVMTSAAHLHVVSADDTPKAQSSIIIEAARPQTSSQLDQLRGNPDDVRTLQSFVDDAAREIGMLAYFHENIEAAERRLKDFEAAMAQLNPKTDEAKEQITIAKKAVIPERTMLIAAARTSLADLEAALAAKPITNDDFLLWSTKLNMEIDNQAQRDPDAAKRTLDAAMAFAARIAATPADRNANRGFELFQRSQARRLEQRIDSATKFRALVGTDAPWLDVQCWVNGPSLSIAELKGKVILLDFFHVAVRVSSVPHVRQWHEHYVDKGLVVIGLTRPFRHQWDEMEHRLVATPPIVRPTIGQQKVALEKVTAFHKLKYPLAIAGMDSYQSSLGTLDRGIVVIDQQGKVRMARVPHRERDAREIGDLLAKLLDPAATK